MFDHRLQLWSVGVLAAGVVGEHLVQFDPVELAVGVLVYGADPHVADGLALAQLRPLVFVLHLRVMLDDVYQYDKDPS